MSAEAATSILDAALQCFGQRILTILSQPGGKSENYVASLHNEVLAATWIVGLLSSGGSPPYVPESVKIAFHSFSDIGNPHTYIPPDESRLLQVKVKKSDSSKFNFTEWWKVREGEILREPFDVGDEVTAALLRAVEMQQAGAQLRTKIMEGFKKAWELSDQFDRLYSSICSNLELDGLRHFAEANLLENARENATSD